ncbi:ArsA-related P-loop ATPase [Actinospongicola halichondriae]|uniref:ArsA-related P-loop ATPase n=1 Tax=Actinospongicola halichondriae TaxID=3236844 RepID=UPI003D5C655F
MKPTEYFAASRLLIVAGKGGVGKTVVTAALARAAAMAGRSALIVEVEGKSGLPRMFGHPELGYDELVLHKGGGKGGDAEVSARTITPDAALIEYLEDHGLSRISKRLVSSGALDVVATAAPGIRDILVLGKVKQLQRSEAADVIILDAPAAGHAITFLRSARGLMDAVKVGPINTQAKDVLELLEDHDACQVLLVTLPEETPVNELVETAFSLEDQVGVGLGPVVVNGLYERYGGLAESAEAAADEAGVSLLDGEAEALDEASAFRRHRIALQAEQVSRLSEQLPLPQLEMPFLFESEIGPDELDVLARAMLTGIEALDADLTLGATS